MKKLFLLFLLFSGALFGQEYKFAWVTDIHIGYPTAEADLDSVVSLINSFDEIEFTIASGDIAEKGKNDELETAKKILDKLDKPYYIIPGNHDTKWSESGLQKFNELWGGNKFSFEKGNDLFIGINSGIPWRGGGGHITPEDLGWLKEKISEADGKEVYFVIHHPLNQDIDNWYKASNILRDANAVIVMHGHGHGNKITNFNGFDGAMARSTLSKDKNSFGFTLVENTEDSLKFFEVEKDTIPAFWGGISKTDSLNVPLVDSADFKNINAEVIWQKNLNATFINEPLVAEDYIITSTMGGIITCFDSTGREVWAYDAFGNIFARPAYKDGILAAATVQGDLITLDIESGMNLQTIGFDEPITSQLSTIEYKGDKKLMMPKESGSNAAVVFGTASGKLYCYDLETLEQIWVNETAKGMIQTRPVVYDDKIYYGAWDGKFYSVDAKTGWMIWQWNDDGGFYYAPAASVPVLNKDNVYFTSPNKNVYAVDRLLGRTVWKNDKFQAWESVGISDQGHRLFIKSVRDEMAIAAAKNGNWVKRLKVGFGLDTMPVTPIEDDGNILYGTKDGYIRMVDEKFNTSEIMFAGTARTFTVLPYKDMFLASNMDGKLILFRYGK